MNKSFQSAPLFCGLIWVGILVFIGRVSVSAFQNPPFVCGDWQITGVIGYARVASQPNKSFIGRTIRYAPSAMTSGNLVFRQPGYRIERWSTAKFADQIEKPERLGLSGEWVVVVRVMESTASESEVAQVGSIAWFKNDKELGTMWDGILYGMTRVGKPCSDLTVQ